MPAHTPIFWAENKDRYLRQLLIADIESITGRPLVVYYCNSEITSRITQDDVLRFSEIITPYAGRTIDILIESEGGALDATETIISFIRKTIPSFRAIVPRRAKSNGTLICLAAQELMMGPTSELGPIEPKVDDIPATLLTKDSLIDRYPLGHQSAIFALRHTKEIAKIALTCGLMSRSADAEVEACLVDLCSRDRYAIHGAVIDEDEARRHGFELTDGLVRDAVWRHIIYLFAMYDYDTHHRQISKIFEARTVSMSVLGPEPANMREEQGGL